MKSGKVILEATNDPEGGVAAELKLLIAAAEKAGAGHFVLVGLTSTNNGEKSEFEVVYASLTNKARNVHAARLAISGIAQMTEDAARQGGVCSCKSCQAIALGLMPVIRSIALASVETLKEAADVSGLTAVIGAGPKVH